MAIHDQTSRPARSTNVRGGGPSVKLCVVYVHGFTWLPGLRIGRRGDDHRGTERSYWHRCRQSFRGYGAPCCRGGQEEQEEQEVEARGVGNGS